VLTGTATAHDAPSARAAVRPMLRNFTGLRAVLTPSDGTAAGAIAALTARHRAGDVAVTGNGATVVGLQHVLAGTQCFTVYHPPAPGARALVKTLLRLVTFRPVNTARTLPAANGHRTALVQYGGARIVRRSNVKDVIDSGYVRREDVCTGVYAARCTAAGI
jgi:D-xylose transport system substrate-binding protein